MIPAIFIQISTFPTSIIHWIPSRSNSPSRLRRTIQIQKKKLQWNCIKKEKRKLKRNSTCLCSFPLCPLFLIIPSTLEEIVAALTRHSPVCVPFPSRNRWSLLLKFKHAATGSSGENRAPDGLTASRISRMRLSDPVALNSFCYPRVSAAFLHVHPHILRSFLSNVCRMFSIAQKCCRWSLRHAVVP